MAITLVGSNQQRSFGSDSDPLTFVLPTHAIDDFGIITVHQEGLNGTPNITCSTTGWAEATESSWVSSVGTARTLACFYKKFTSASETNPQVDFNGIVRQHAGCVHVFRSVHTTTPFDTAIVDGEFTDIINPNQPDITTQTANACILLYHYFTHNEHTACDTVSGYTLSENLKSDTASNEGFASAYLLDAGASGSKTPGAWQHSGTAVNSDSTCLTIALRFASGPVITDVNTTESWTDGDTGLVITGTGFV